MFHSRDEFHSPRSDHSIENQERNESQRNGYNPLSLCPFASSFASTSTSKNSISSSSKESIESGFEDVDTNPSSAAVSTTDRQYYILDETDESDSYKGSDDEDSYISDEEVEKMLDNALENNKRKASEAGLDDKRSNKKDKTRKRSRPTVYQETTKVVLIEKDKNHFEVLPEGWMQVTHYSGMPVYLHRESRVCTLARPYFLGPGSVRHHDVPLGAIPCLSYRRHIEREEKEKTEMETLPNQENGDVNEDQEKENGDVNEDQEKENGDASAETNVENTNPSPQKFPNAKVQTINENIHSQSVKPLELRKYCENIFNFDEIKVVKCNSWLYRRQKFKENKIKEHLQRPKLPNGTTLITFPLDKDQSTKMKREWILNPNGKSFVCILHEYVQHVLKKQPSYKFKELENAATPYSSTVIIDDMQYGMGCGASKRQAKVEAARITLEILIPEMRQKILKDQKTGNSISKENDYDFSFFDSIKIEDPRLAEFCAKTNEPSPYDILLTCLQRNFDLGRLQVEHYSNTVKHQMNEFTMSVGKHSATVMCRTKKEGKQRASQGLLQALHPHVQSWGSLLRLYGTQSVKSLKEKKFEEQEITQLQTKAAANTINKPILNKLNQELRKLYEKRHAVKPIGILVQPANQLVPKLSSSNLKKVDL